MFSRSKGKIANVAVVNPMTSIFSHAAKMGMEEVDVLDIYSDRGGLSIDFHALVSKHQQCVLPTSLSFK